jgi:hypothetical protein
MSVETFEIQSSAELVDTVLKIGRSLKKVRFLWFRGVVCDWKVAAPPASVSSMRGPLHLRIRRRDRFGRAHPQVEAECEGNSVSAPTG